MNLWDAVDRIKQIQKKKRALQEESRRARQRATSVNDLAARFHQVGDVKLPYPTLFSLGQMELHFGKLDRIDLNQFEHVAAVAYFLKNGGNADISSLQPVDQKRAILAEMASIPAEALPEYQECISQMFLALKKKSIQYQTAFLRHYLDRLGVDLPAEDGKTS